MDGLLSRGAECFAVRAAEQGLLCFVRLCLLVSCKRCERSSAAPAAMLYDGIRMPGNGESALRLVLVLSSPANTHVACVLR